VIATRTQKPPTAKSSDCKETALVRGSFIGRISQPGGWRKQIRCPALRLLTCSQNDESFRKVSGAILNSPESYLAHDSCVITMAR
jgi:hypothetical protein